MTRAEERRLRVQLRRENEYLRGERDRFARLLAMTLRIASGDGRDCDPLELLDVVAALIGEPLATPAFVIERQARREQVGRRLEQLRTTTTAKEAA